MPFKFSSAAFIGLFFLATTALEAKTEKSTSASKALIERSAIILPKVINGYQLVDFSFEEKHKFSGVQARYVSNKYPDIAIDFFVYPVGTGPENKILASGMEDFVGSLKQAEELGYFEKLVIEPEQDLLLNKNGLQLKPKEKTGTATTSSALAKKIDKEAVMASLLEEKDLSGKKLFLSHTQKSAPMQSLGYLFYRQLYFTKVRVTIASDKLSSDEFNTMADAAVSNIVPMIESRNVGSCTNSTITVGIPENAGNEDTSDIFMQQLVNGLNRRKADNCVEDLQLNKISKSDFEVITIEYTPEDWGN